MEQRPGKETGGAALPASVIGYLQRRLREIHLGREEGRVSFQKFEHMLNKRFTAWFCMFF
jgi:hypothetical protein